MNTELLEALTILEEEKDISRDTGTYIFPRGNFREKYL